MLRSETKKCFFGNLTKAITFSSSMANIKIIVPEFFDTETALESGTYLLLKDIKSLSLKIIQAILKISTYLSRHIISIF